jgi:ornithine cyclodeaminase/alanine dehydrogenase-like protein (mu-crystallin family)
MIKPGCTALPVDDLVLYEPGTEDCFDKAYTDDRGQFQHFKDMGFFRAFQELPAELGEVIVGKAEGRTSHDEKILTVNIGTGLADVGTARMLYDRAIAEGIGTKLPL